MANGDLIRKNELLRVLCANCRTAELGIRCAIPCSAYTLTKEAFTVDAVEVVRCKDCAHYHDDLCGKIQWIMDGYYSGTFERKQPLDFCSQAEKKGTST